MVTDPRVAGGVQKVKEDRNEGWCVCVCVRYGTVVVKFQNGKIISEAHDWW
jgi:hypothetical protein